MLKSEKSQGHLCDDVAKQRNNLLMTLLGKQIKTIDSDLTSFSTAATLAWKFLKWNILHLILDHTFVFGKCYSPTEHRHFKLSAPFKNLRLTRPRLSISPHFFCKFLASSVMHFFSNLGFYGSENS